MCVAPAAFGGLVTLPGANDSLDFSTYTVGATLGQNFDAFSSSSTAIGIQEQSSAFAVVQQGSGWVGNFPAGTVAIYDQGPIGPVSFDFFTPIQGFGINIDDAVGGNYQGTIQAYNNITSLSLTTSASQPPGLLFLSVVDATADITTVQISTTAVTNNLFAFTDISLIEATTPLVGVPEPASIGVLAMGLVILSVKRITSGYVARLLAGPQVRDLEIPVVVGRLLHRAATSHPTESA
jgi:hypothetical protein